MKDSEFMELLNLYLDHEIDAENAARLEAEVMGNPARRRIYRQYCQIDRACSQLSEEFGAAAPEAGRITAPAGQRWSWAASIYAGSLAAAACVAVFAVLRMRTATPAPEQASAGVARILAAPQPTVQAALASAADRDLQPVVAVRNLFLNGAGRSARASLATAMDDNDPLAWMTRVPAVSVPAGQGIFASSPVLLSPDNPDDRAPARPGSDLQAPVEMAAFRFQR